jgi:hypothetical protein
MSSDPSPPDRKPTIFGRPAAAAFLAVLAFVILGANYLTGGFGADGPASTADPATASEESKMPDVVAVRIETGGSSRPREVDADPDLEAAVENLESTTRRFAAEQKKQRMLDRFRPLPGGVEMAQLEQIASCESGGDPEIISSNGLYHGKYQFHPDTWESVGGKGLPSDAPEVEQDYRAALLLDRSGPGQWPVCGA